jgi:biopolymer transport protein ExbD
MNFRKTLKSEHVGGLQLVPMLDVMFNILAFFIATQIFAQWETEIDVKLPTAETGAVPQRLPGEIIINITKDGHVVVNEQEQDSTSLADLLGRVVHLFPNQSVLIRADQATAYEHVIRVLDVCRGVDVYNIAFATTAADSK